MRGEWVDDKALVCKGSVESPEHRLRRDIRSYPGPVSTPRMVLTAPSRTVTMVAFVLATWALGATARYLSPVLPGGWPNLLLAAALLFGPLVGSLPLPFRRAFIAAGLWLVLGLPGGYLFGVFVSCAAVGLAVAAGVLAFLVTGSRRRLAGCQ